MLLARSDAAAELMTWIPLMETQSGRKLQILRSDNGGGFKTNKLRDWMKKRGSAQQFIPAYTPQSNRIAERMNGTSQYRASTMMLKAEVHGSL